MARQRLGMAAKSKVASVRITPNEEAVLTERFGTPSKALRGFVNQVMENEESKDDA
jgi:hypothetical protein